MKEIFEMQRQLNIFTLRKLDLDYLEVITDPKTIPIWVENYRKALSAELAELARDVEKCGVGSRNGKIEIIDMLHFLVSLSHLVGVEPSETDVDTGPKQRISYIIIDGFLCLDNLQNSLKWKWWAKGGGYKPQEAKEAVLNLWKCFWRLCHAFELDFEAVKKLYIAKNEVNFKRQQDGYSEDTKTEEDNLAIVIP
jgi:dimeric dUTPase (all-alpha-NTP-PPase superfamily)